VAKQGSGVMLAFWPDPEMQKQLAVEGGEPADSLHVTLAYFGKPGDLNMENLPVLELMLANFAATHGPVNGTLSGLGRFPATPQSDGQDVIYLGVHLDGVQQFRRELVEATKLAGFTPKDNFGFNPHLTLNFVSPHAPHLMATPDPVPVTFGKVVLTNGADRTEFPLTGEDEDRGELEYTKFEIEGTIVKADEDKKQVFGWFSVISIDGKSITDTQGDLITADTLEAAAYDYVLETRKGGEMHETTKGDVRQVGRLIESCVFTREKQKAMQESLRGQDIHATLDLGSVGWWGGFQIDDSGTWKNIKNGQLRAFSIGGKGKRQKLD
jgi:2'-5' RNA ligase